MIRASIRNVRTKTDKRQIIQYLTLRMRIFHQKIVQPDKKTDVRVLKKRHSELIKLYNLISMDKIDKEIRTMHQYIHRQNEYLGKIEKEKEKERSDLDKKLSQNVHNANNGRKDD